MYSERVSQILDPSCVFIVFLTYRVPPRSVPMRKPERGGAMTWQMTYMWVIVRYTVLVGFNGYG